jgi:ribosomal protein S18 acetylase RimI-like enzyme
MIKEESIDLIQVTTSSEITDELKAIYEEAFPPDERRDWDQVLELLKKSEYKLFSVISQQKTVGLLIGWYFPDFTFIEHFAIEKSARSKGFGNLIIHNFLANLSGLVILEVEEANTETGQRRISFYKKFGFSVFPGEYFQPAYSPAKKSVKMLILSYPDKITNEEFRQIRTELYRSVYQIRD